MNTRIVRYLFGTTIGSTIAVLLLVLPTPARAAPDVPQSFTISAKLYLPLVVR